MTVFALVGRTNAGKSTLFNRLARRKLAIVHATPGVTRDRKEAMAEIGGKAYKIIDTAGLEPDVNGELFKDAWRQTMRAVDEADAVLFVFDARRPLSHTDRDLIKTLRKSGKPWIPVGNKVEGAADPERFPGLFESGAFVDPLAISAEHNEGMADLYARMTEFPPFTDEERNSDLTVAVVGRPNVGKSTLINALSGEERVLTAPVAGTTRDAVTVRTKDFNLVDTAGQRKGAKVTGDLEALSLAEASRALRFAHVAVLVVDAAGTLDKQDLSIAATAIAGGRALVVALNKWDAVSGKDRAAALKGFKDRLSRSLPEVKRVPVVTMSALKGKGLPGLVREIKEVYALWNSRVATGRLNRWFEKATAAKAPPLSTTGRRVNLKYVTQAKARPPQFVIFTSSRMTDLPESYRRYLLNGLGKEFGLDRVPVRLTLSKSRNPFTKKNLTK